MYKNMETDLTKQRDERCVPIVNEIYKIIAEVNPVILDDDKEQEIKDYTLLTERVLQLLLEKKSVVEENDYIYRLLLAPVFKLKAYMESSLGRSIKTVDNYLWKKESGKNANEVNFEDLDIVLKKISESKQ